LGGLLLINPRAGSAAGPAAAELRDEALAREIEARILREGEDPAEHARTADAEILGAAGGDGSVATVAAVAIERGLPFVCVPYGTRNHFARDLGLDRNDPIGALAGFVGEERPVDVGRIGGRRFLNNVSLGIYASLVHRREHHRRRGQVLAGARALWLGLGRRCGVWATLEGDPVRARIVLVANNAYQLDLFSIGERDRLDEGRLHVYTARGWLPSAWEERSGDRFRIDAPGSSLEVAIDGEPAVVETPLEFSIEPSALRVLVPRAPG
jgi:diacylglycerol kinase family enzyme